MYKNTYLHYLNKEQAMCGWNAWARAKAEAVRAPVWPWISETLREARGIGEFDPRLKDYPPPRMRGRQFRQTASVNGGRTHLPVSGRAAVGEAPIATRSGDWQLAERVAHAGGNAPQPQIFGSGGALNAATLAPRQTQNAAAVEVATNGLSADEMQMHHGSTKETPNGATSPAGGMRPRVTDDEIARVLTYIECGYSLRQAAAAVGRNHVSVLRCIRRSPELAAEYRQKQQLAREQPLRQLHEASQRSWRAAAWLLTYLDRRDTQRRAKNNDRHAAVSQK